MLEVGIVTAVGGYGGWKMIKQVHTNCEGSLVK